MSQIIAAIVGALAVVLVLLGKNAYERTHWLKDQRRAVYVLYLAAADEVLLAVINRRIAFTTTDDPASMLASQKMVLARSAVALMGPEHLDDLAGELQDKAMSLGAPGLTDEAGWEKVNGAYHSSREAFVKRARSILGTDKA